MTSPSAARGQSTRQRLLAAAVSLIGEVGWSNVSTRLVAERAGVAPGVVHYHFSSVTDLLVAACDSVLGDLLETTARRLTEQPDVESGLAWLLAEADSYPGDDPTSLLFVEAFLAATRTPELRTSLSTTVSRFRTTVADWLRGQGHDDPEAAATVLAAALDGLLLHRATDPELDLTTLAGSLHRLLRPNPEEAAR